MTYWIIYNVIALISGYAHTRGCYNRTSWRTGDIPGQSPGWAFIVWVLYGLTWPLWAVVFGVIAIQTLVPIGARWLAEHLFTPKRKRNA